MQKTSETSGNSQTYLSSAAVLVGAAALSTALNAQTGSPTDLQVLNYALTLENLEAAFYTQGLRQFSSADFGRGQFALDLGNAQAQFGDSISSDVFAFLLLIRDHEQAHVRALSATVRSLGGVPAPACTYNFSYNSVDDFLAVARTLENTGVAAYDGAANLIQSPSLRQTAATIATVEGRHASYLNLITGQSPFPAAFDPTKTMQEIQAAVAPFIASCPAQ